MGEGQKTNPTTGGANMTENQIQELTRMRQSNMGYSHIAKALGLTKAQVSGYCKRHGLDGTLASNSRNCTTPGYCRCCGAPLNQNPKTKTSYFCSAACRQAWWNTHLNQVNRRAFYDVTCASCGRTFKSYGNKNRKFCSHACYINHRFHKGD